MVVAAVAVVVVAVAQAGSGRRGAWRRANIGQQFLVALLVSVSRPKPWSVSPGDMSGRRQAGRALLPATPLPYRDTSLLGAAVPCLQDTTSTPSILGGAWGG